MPDPLPPLTEDSSPNDQLLEDFLQHEEIETNRWDEVSREAWRSHPLSDALRQTDAALAQLTRLGISQERIDQVRSALRNMNSMPSETFWETAPRLAAELNAPGMTRQRAELMLDILEQAGRNPDLRLDFGRVAAMSAVDLQQFRDLTRNLGALDVAAANGIPPETVNQIRDHIRQTLAGEQSPDRVRQLNDVMTKLNDAAFVREFGAERTRSVFDLLRLQAENPHLRIPVEHFLEKGTNGEYPRAETLRFAVDRYSEARSFGPPHRNARDGVRFEYNAAMAAQEVTRRPFTNGSRWVYIPGSAGSQADAHGVDGVFLNPQTGEVKPVDWTLDMARKRAQGHTMLAVEPRAGSTGPESLVGERIPGRTPAPTDLAFRQVVETAVGNLPATNVERYRVSGHTPQRGQVEFPSFAGDVDPAASRVPQRIEQFSRQVEEAGADADRVMRHLAERGQNALSIEKAKRALAGRLASDIARAVGLDARGHAPDLPPVRPRVQRDGRGQYVEIPLSSPLERSGHPEAVRIYADGTVFWAKDKPGMRPVECFHISELDGVIRPRLEGISDPQQRRAALTALDRINNATAANPIDMSNPATHPAIDVIYRSLTSPREFAAAAQRSVLIDDVTRAVERISEADARAVAERAHTRQSAQMYRDIYDSMLVERRVPETTLTPQRSLEIVQQARQLETRHTLTREASLDAAVLKEVRNMPEADAVNLAGEMQEIRRLNRNLDFSSAARMAAAQLEQTRLAGEAAREFRQVLQDAIRDARPGQELADIRARLLSEAETRGLMEGRIAEGWLAVHGAVERMSDAQLREFLGVPETGNVSEHLRTTSERAAERNQPATPERPAETAPPAPEVRAPETGRRIAFEGTNYEVAGRTGSHTLLYQPGAPAEAVGQEISNTDLQNRYEEVRVTVEGREEIRYIEKGHPERGLYRVQSAAGMRLIALDPAMRVVETARLTAPAAPPPAVPPSVPPERRGEAPPSPPDRPVVERPRPELPKPPTAEALVRTEISVGTDGTLRVSDQRVGESMSLERLREQTELTNEQIRFIEEQAERLKRSTNAEERARGNELAETARALKGEHGPEARARAHRSILENSREELARRRGGGGGAGVGAAVGLGILLSAALGWYLSEQRIPSSPLRRATVGT